MWIHAQLYHTIYKSSTANIYNIAYLSCLCWGMWLWITDTVESKIYWTREEAFEPSQEGSCLAGVELRTPVLSTHTTSWDTTCLSSHLWVSKSIDCRWHSLWRRDGHGKSSWNAGRPALCKHPWQRSGGKPTPAQKSPVWGPPTSSPCCSAPSWWQREWGQVGSPQRSRCWDVAALWREDSTSHCHTCRSIHSANWGTSAHISSTHSTLLHPLPLYPK